MTIQASEKFGTRRGGFWERTFSYEVWQDTGALLADMDALDAVALQLTIDYPLGVDAGGGYYLQCFDITIEEVVDNDRMIVATKWALPEDGGHGLTAFYAFNYQAPTAHITRSLATVGAYDATGAIANPFGGAISVRGGGAAS